MLRIGEKIIRKGPKLKNLGVGHLNSFWSHKTEKELGELKVAQVYENRERLYYSQIFGWCGDYPWSLYWGRVSGATRQGGLPTFWHGNLESYVGPSFSCRNVLPSWYRGSDKEKLHLSGAARGEHVRFVLMELGRLWMLWTRLLTARSSYKWCWLPGGSGYQKKKLGEEGCKGID